MKLNIKNISTSGKLLFRTGIAVFVLFVFVLIAMYYAIDNQFSSTLLKAAEQQLRAKSGEATRYINVRRGQIQVIAKMLEAESWVLADREALLQWLKERSIKEDELCRSAFFR